jgi:hypothetical protein
VARAKKAKIGSEDLQGFKYLKRVLGLFERLHDAACARDRAHNRTLHFDQLCALVVLQLFNPVLDSLRALEQASALERVQRKLGCKRASIGSLSEAMGLFDPDRLLPIIAELNAQLAPVARDPRLRDLKHLVTIVDGTLLKALPRVAEAMWLTTRTGTVHAAWRLHAHFELDKYVPTRMDLTDGRNSGDSDEKNVLRKALEPDRLYVMDRWYAQFKLFNDIHAAASGYVCRVRDNSVFEVLEERALSADARAAGVLRDVVVDMGSSKGRPDHPVRLVLVRSEPHEKRSNRKGNTGAGPSDGIVRIATDLLDVPAEVIALLYRYRYTVELFFRFFKQVLGCRHLMSQGPNGVRIQTYCAIIACMLISLYTGRKPTKRTYEMLCFFFVGLATEAELVAHLGRPDRTGVKRRAKEALWKKLGV